MEEIFVEFPKLEEMFVELVLPVTRPVILTPTCDAVDQAYMHIAHCIEGERVFIET